MDASPIGSGRSSENHHSDAPFRFMDLPLELRNEVYRELLICDNSLKDMKVEGALESIIDSTLVTDLHKWRCQWHPLKVDHGISTSILRTSRQIHVESQYILHHENKFMRVIGLPSILYSAIELDGVPILSMNDCIHEFRGETLEVNISSIRPRRTSAPEVGIGLLMLAKHLPLLAEWLAEYPRCVIGRCITSVTLTLSDILPVGHSMEMSMLAPFRSLDGCLGQFVTSGQRDHQVSPLVGQEPSLHIPAADLNVRINRLQCAAAEAKEHKRCGRHGIAIRCMGLSVSVLRHYYTKQEIELAWQDQTADPDIDRLVDLSNNIDEFWTKQPGHEMRPLTFDILAYKAIRTLHDWASSIEERQSRQQVAPSVVYDPDRLFPMRRSAEAIKCAGMEWEGGTEEDFAMPGDI